MWKWSSRLFHSVSISVTEVWCMKQTGGLGNRVCLCACVRECVCLCGGRVVGVEGVCITFFHSLGSAEMQYNSLAELPCMKLLSTDLDHLSCYLPHPCFSISENSTSCFQWGAAFMYKIREKLLIKKHTSNNWKTFHVIDLTFPLFT